MMDIGTSTATTAEGEKMGQRKNNETDESDEKKWHGGCPDIGRKEEMKMRRRKEKKRERERRRKRKREIRVSDVIICRRSGVRRETMVL
jgi:hypothetical protein